MNNRQLLLAIGLVVLVNLLVLAGVAWNRSGEPEASLVLTERELPSYWRYDKEENTGVALQLDWHRYSNADWFGADKLRDVGFDVDSIEPNERSWDYFSNLLPRKGYVVLELEGETWQRWRDEKLKEIAELERERPADDDDLRQQQVRLTRLRDELDTASRLFAIDAGGDPQALRRRYPERSRYAIVAAEIRARYTNDDKRLYGLISDLLNERLHVPRSVGAPLTGLPARERWSVYDEPLEPRNWRPYYTVAVHWGARHEPWIEAIELTAAGAAAAGE